MKNISILIKITLAVLFFSEVAIGCICPNRFAPPCADYSNADVVLIGKVQKLGKPYRAELYNVVTANLIVEKSFKGNQSKEIEVDFPLGDCGYENLKLGQKYFVYARSAGLEGRLEIPTCSRTAILEKAQVDVNYANNVEHGKEDSSIVGRILNLTYYEKVKVIVKSEKNVKEFFLNSDGTYKIPSFGQSNKYEVKFLFPFEITSTIFKLDNCPPSSGVKTCIEYEVELKDSGCSYFELPLSEVNY